ncbi:hypothetical protein ACLOJK_019013 [Asimina triloba]
MSYMGQMVGSSGPDGLDERVRIQYTTNSVLHLLPMGPPWQPFRITSSIADQAGSISNPASHGGQSTDESHLHPSSDDPASADTVRTSPRSDDHSSNPSTGEPNHQQRNPISTAAPPHSIHHVRPKSSRHGHQKNQTTINRSSRSKPKQQKPICSLPPLLSTSDPAGQMINLKIRCAHPIDPISATTATHQQHRYSSIWVDLLTMDERSYKEIPFRNQHRGQRLQHHDPEQAGARAKSSCPLIIKQWPTTPANAPAAPNFSHSPAPDRPPGQTAIKNPQTASPMARANFSEYPH